MGLGKNFSEHELFEPIKHIFQDTFEIDIENRNTEKLPQVTLLLKWGYYKQKEPELKASISQLFPKQCSDQWIREITNRSELSWDIDTLQTSFLDPINHYVQNKPNYFYSLGGILFLESSGILSGATNMRQKYTMTRQRTTIHSK